MPVQAISSNEEAKKLAAHIDSFLFHEYFYGNYLTKAERNIFFDARMFLKEVYRITLWNSAAANPRFLKSIFDLARRPVPVKDRIAAKNHKQKGNEFMEAERFDLAEAEYTSAVERDPRNPVYYCNRAAARVRLLMFASAVDDCKTAIKWDRHYAKAYGWLGIARAMTNHPARAVRCFKKALKIEPGNEAYLANIQLINRRMNRITLIVLKPFFACSRSFRRRALTVVNDLQAIFRSKNSDEADKGEYVMEFTCVIKYTTENVD